MTNASDIMANFGVMPAISWTVPLTDSVGNALSSSEYPTETTKQSSSEVNIDQKRIDEEAALRLIPFQALDQSQKFANAGDTMPLVFCKRVSNRGGVWFSPPLLEVVSNDFVSTYVYLITHGQTLLNPNHDFLGARAFKDIVFASAIIRLQGYTTNPATCPLSLGASCDHSVFKYQGTPLAPEIGDVTSIRTINNYTTAITIKVKPLYPDGISSFTSLERYNLTVTRTANATNTTATVGTIVTSATGSITSISDTPAAANYTYSIQVTSVNTVQIDKPASILIEIVQTNTFPASYDRTSSYTNMTLKIIQGNLYDSNKEFSPPGGLKQLHVFMDAGVYVISWRWVNPSNPAGSSPPYSLTTTLGPSDIFADLIQYWFKNSGKFPNQNFQNFFLYDIADTAIFHENYNIRFNGVLSTSTNFFSWVQTLAPFFLCTFTAQYSLYRLIPVLPLNSSKQIHPGDLSSLIRETFSDTDTSADSVTNSIIAGTYRKTYKSTDQRVPFQVVVTWRDQNVYNLETTQTTTVRYSDYPATAPEETYDMSAFCTYLQHAVIFAKYVLATRRYSQHTISFQTARNVLETSGLTVCDLIAVSLTRTNSTGDNRTETNHYLVDSIEYDQTGIVTITASHFPLNGSNIGVINDSILNGSFSVIS